MIDFKSYIKMGDLGGKQRAEAWEIAIGLKRNFLLMVLNS